MKRVMIVFLSCLLLLSGAAPASAEASVTDSAVDVAAQKAELGAGCFSVVLMEVSTGTVLYESGADDFHPIASVTKVMSLLLIAEAIDAGRISKTDLVTVSENAASKGGSQIYLEVGEQMSVHDLLKAVVVSSANDGIVALGEYVSGSEGVFVSEMNRRAQELGLSTVFVNPTGLDDEEFHESTAREVAVISRELLKHEWITEYSTIWMDSVRDGAFGLTNTNRLVRFYQGTTGLKTGSTSKAKYCISASARRDGLHLIAVVLGAESSDRRFAAAKELLDYGFANFSLYSPKTVAFEPIRIWGGKEPYVQPVLQAQGLLVKKSDVPSISEEVTLPQQLEAPLEPGQKLGEVVYRLNGEVVATHEICAEKSVQRVDFAFLFCKLLCMAFG